MGGNPEFMGSVLTGMTFLSGGAKGNFRQYVGPFGGCQLSAGQFPEMSAKSRAAPPEKPLQSGRHFAQNSQPNGNLLRRNAKRRAKSQRPFAAGQNQKPAVECGFD